MAGTQLELANQGGTFNLDPGNLILSDDFVRLSELALANLTRWLLVTLYDNGIDAPQVGVTDSANLTVSKGAGDLDYNVATGLGMSFDSTNLNSDPFASEAFRFVVLDTADSGTLAAHDATNPRIDLVSIAPATVADQGEARASRSTTPPNPSVVPDPTVQLRNRLSGTVTVTTGTAAASPSPPALPAGHLALAEIDVPASSGAITVRDRRQLLQWGLRASPPTSMTALGWVRELGSNLEPQAVSGALVISPGFATVNGLERFYSGDVTIPAASSGQVRADGVYAAADGTIGRLAGTEVAAPGPPTPPTLAAIAALGAPIGTAGVTDAGVIIGGSVTDLRTQAWIDETQLRDDSVTESAIGDDAIVQRHVATQSRTFCIPGAVFRPDAPSVPIPTYEVANNVFAPISTNEAFRLTAPVQLPQGAVVSSITLRIDSLAGALVHQFNLRLFQVAKSDATATEIGLVQHTGTANTTTSGSDASISPDTIDNTLNYYYVEITFTSAAASAASNRILGVDIEVATDQHLS